MICSSVLLPQPLWPMRPSVSPRGDLEADVTQRPERLARLAAPADQPDEPLLEPASAPVVQGEALGHAVQRNGRGRHPGSIAT